MFHSCNPVKTKAFWTRVRFPPAPPDGQISLIPPSFWFLFIWWGCSGFDRAR